MQVGHIFRFHPVTAALRAALEEGRLGRVRYATGRFAGFKRPRTDVGVTHTDAIHYFDLFAYLFQREPTTVSALQRDFLGRGLDDMSVALVTYGDIPTVIEANYFLPGTHRECVLVTESALRESRRQSLRHASTVASFTPAGDARPSRPWRGRRHRQGDSPRRREEPLRAGGDSSF